jgi:hypothetical protein
MDEKKINEASTNILQTSRLEVDQDDQQQENKDQVISPQKSPMNDSEDLSDAEEPLKNTNQVLENNRNDQGMN